MDISIRKNIWICSILDDDGERELQCPKCGCPKLLFEEDMSECTSGFMYFGKKAACAECGHNFVVTEKCWVTVPCECDECS